MEEHPLEEPGYTSKALDPCILVIFGASGDLTARKLMPAIYNLKRSAQLPTHFACVGFARRDKNHDDFRNEMKEAINEHSRIKPIDDALWDTFKERIFYHRSEFHDEAGYNKLKDFLAELDARYGTKGNRIFYLSTQPTFFPTIVEQLSKAGLIYDAEKEKNRWSRVIIEKPFGHDLDTAISLQEDLLRHLKEKQIYRIDHYLGKETVQNILVFRFANSIFESNWNNRYIDHIQITVAEDIGIEKRGRFYEEQGLVRDIMQNHMMQLLSLVAMDPPVNLDADSIRDEKVKILKAVRPFSDEALETAAIRGQYGSGYIGGEKVNGYREEENVANDSNQHTFGAVKLFVDNWRWNGVPFYLRGGKRLPKRATEIAITFKNPPPILFQKGNQNNEPNVLAIRIQPNEGIALKINSKVPGTSSPIQPVTMDFRYGAFFGLAPPDAYERLICDCILGDNTLFAREDEVYNSWKLFTPLLQYWDSKKEADFPNYEAGSWGPKAADEMIEADGRKWRLI